MVSELGMSEKIGPISYAERQGSDFLGTELMRGKIHSEETAREIDEEVIRILNEAYERAVSLLTEHKGAVEELAQALLRYETITGGEVARLLEGGTASDLRPEDAQSSSAKSDPEPRAHLPEERTSEGEGPGELPGEPGLSPA